MRWAGAILASLGLILVGGPAWGAPRSAITEPDWEELPDSEMLADHFPKLAAALEIEGAVTISCFVNAVGRLTGCTTLSETPRDLGFGAAALAMSDNFRMKPQTLNGLPVDGGTVRIPISFRLPSSERSSRPPPALSNEALKQGLRLIDALGMAETVTQLTETAFRYMYSPGLPDDSRDAAREAFAKALAAHKSEYRTAYAQALASVFSEEEMAQLAIFAEGLGKVLKENTDLNMAQLAISQDTRWATITLAHESFCAKHVCPPPTALAQVWKAVEGGDGRIDNPQWARTPADYALSRAATVPIAIGLPGAARLTCRVEKAGGLADCKVDEALPAGLGFGVAALGLAKNYRLDPLQLAAGAEGKKVTLRVGFMPPTPPAPYMPDETFSETSLKLAHQVAAASTEWDTTQRDIEIRIVELQSKRPKGADAKLLDEAIAAYRQGATAAVARSREHLAKAWAAALTEEQMVTFANFHASAAGKAQQERSEALLVAMGKAAMSVRAAIAADARATYCKIRDCTAPPRSTPEILAGSAKP